MATIIKEVSSTIAALNGSSTVVDISDADVLSVHITGTYSGTVSLYASNDGVTYHAYAMHAITQTTSTTDTASTSAASTLLTKPCGSLKYFKAVMTAYTSGSVTVTVVASRYGK
jgi:hypothetical protein